MRFKLLCPGFGARVGGLISWMIPRWMTVTYGPTRKRT